ncbi:MAG TPA: SDR family NAD(P)-dependent oxidoreductase [Chthoniobacterales bacterium]|nr:SDR family NAD(P)-dependent oxidoreductase [Chthoniobacterales bacterium]
MSAFDLTGCSALITGASAGIGREFARQLAGRAGSLVLVARRLERLEELRDELTKKDPNLNVHVRAADLSQAGAVDELCAWLDREGIAIDFLINNAGLGDRGSFASAEPGRVREMMAVNIVALTTLTRALLPPMLEKKRGAILNVSSIAGFLPIRKFAVYAASKAYVTSFSEGLRAEVRKKGIAVTALCPGPVATEFSSVAQRPDGKPEMGSPSFIQVPVEEVVRTGLNAIERNKPLAIPGIVMKIATVLVRLTPMAILRRV